MVDNEPSSSAESTDTEESIEQPIDGPRLKAPPKKQPKLRAGSFFAYKPVNLGQDPNLAVEKKSECAPKPGEPIDFTNHVLPILEDRCFSCHQEPFTIKMVEPFGRKSWLGSEYL